MTSPVQPPAPPVTPPAPVPLPIPDHPAPPPTPRPGPPGPPPGPRPFPSSAALQQKFQAMPLDELDQLVHYMRGPLTFLALNPPSGRANDLTKLAFAFGLAEQIATQRHQTEPNPRPDSNQVLDQVTNVVTALGS